MQDLLIKEARDCRTKSQWRKWLTLHGKTVSETNNSKLLEEVFKLLSKDAHSLQYGEDLWACLLEGCLSSWNLELGRKIADFALKIRAPEVILPSAKLYLESGFPGKARQMVTNAQRLSNLETKQKLQLDTLNCSAYIEEGKRQQATRILKRIAKNVYDASLSSRDRADFLTYVARTHFLLGRYKEASAIFEEISKVYEELHLWELTAKSIFNAAASLENAGEGSQEFTFDLVERARCLAEEHDLMGTLAHCEAFYGHNDYWRGNFAGAREHYRRALQHIPASDKSYRRLHLLSMLAFTYMRTGRFHLAKKFGQQTLDLAALEETDRFALRYDNLEAEILCEEGLFAESQELLSESTSMLLQKGVHTLEDLAIASRYIFQSAMLNDNAVSAEFELNDGLGKNKAALLEFTHALAHQALAKGDLEGARQLFKKCKSDSKEIEDQYYRALSWLGLIEVAFQSNESLKEIEKLLKKFQIYAGRMVETPLKGRTKIVQAAIEYRKGNFDRCASILNAASKLPRLSYIDKFCMSAWISTVEGRATRFPTPEHEKLLARMTSVYFNPTIKRDGEKKYTVSHYYQINLEKHGSIDQFLHYLMNASGHESQLENLQTQVWSQSTHQLGWQQKIRNTINRTRGFFPYTMAPLVIHDKSVRLFKEAIHLEQSEPIAQNNHSRLLQLLKQSPQSSKQVADQLNISPATAKRLLKQMTDNSQIVPMKIGRRVFYQHADS